MVLIEFFTVVIVTWNLNMKDPPQNEMNLGSLFGLPQPDTDVFVVGLQEAPKKNYLRKSWTEVFEKTFDDFDYKEVVSKRLRNIKLLVFVKKDLIKSENLSFITKSSRATGIFNYIGNKGATVACLEIYKVSTCFVNSHLNAFRGGENRREKDVHRISKMPPLLDESQNTIFWFGDLNFRLKDENNNPLKDTNGIIELLKTSEGQKKVFKYDELTKLMQEGKVFDKFVEGKQPLFKPTYKFEIKSQKSDKSETSTNFEVDQYNTERIPAWTDRILYREANNKVEQLSYESVTGEEYTISDHRPVRAKFRVTVEQDLNPTEVSPNEIYEIEDEKQRTEDTAETEKRTAVSDDEN